MCLTFRRSEPMMACIRVLLGRLFRRKANTMVFMLTKPIPFGGRKRGTRRTARGGKGYEAEAQPFLRGAGRVGIGFAVERLSECAEMCFAC